MIHYNKSDTLSISYQDILDTNGFYIDSFSKYCNTICGSDYFKQWPGYRNSLKKAYTKLFSYYGTLIIREDGATCPMFILEHIDFYIVMVRVPACASYCIVPKTLLGVWLYQTYKSTL